MIRLALLACALVVVDVPTAAACSCYFDFMLPRDGSTDVPTNLGAVIVSGSLTTTDVELRVGDETGPAVPLGLKQAVWGPGQSVYLVPLGSSLDPDTVYAVTRFGVLVSRFTTGSTVDEEAPAAITVDELSIEYVERDGDSGSCNPSDLTIASRLEVPPDAVAVWARFARDAVVQERLLPYAGNADFGLGALGTGTCSIRIDVQPDHTYDVEVWARDLAGNEGPITTTSVTVTQGCDGCSSSSASTLALLVLVPLLRRRRR